MEPELEYQAPLNADLCFVEKVLKWYSSLLLHAMTAKGHVAVTHDVTDRISAKLSYDEREYFSLNIVCTEEAQLIIT